MKLNSKTDNKINMLLDDQSIDDIIINLQSFLNSPLPDIEEFSNEENKDIKQENNTNTKKKWNIFSVLLIILFLFISQRVLFSKGIIPSYVKSYELHINSGRCIQDDSSLIVPIGENIEIESDLKMIPSYGNIGSIEYSIDNKEIATCESNNIKALKEGNTRLNIIRNNKTIHSFDLNVVKPMYDITMKFNNELKYIGDTTSIKTEVKRKYDFGEGTHVTYSSSDESVAKVDKNGKVTASGIGTSIITAYYNSKTVEKEVVINPKVLDLVLENEIKIAVDDTYNLKVDVQTSPQSNIHPPITYKLTESNSNDKPILEIDEYGKIKALSPGKQEITVVCDNIKKNVVVTVTEKSITNIQVNNLKETHFIKDGYVYIDLTWDTIDTQQNHVYNIFAKTNYDNQFINLGNIIPKPKDPTKMSAQVSRKLDDLDGNIDIQIYVTASNDYGESIPSNVVNINLNNSVNRKSIADIEVKNLKETHFVKDGCMYIDLTWDAVDMEDNWRYNITGKYNTNKYFYHFGEVKPSDKNQKKVSKQVKVDLENMPNNTILELYVTVSNGNYSNSKKSNIVSIDFSDIVNRKSIRDTEIKNLKETHFLKDGYMYIDLTWDGIEMEDDWHYDITGKYSTNKYLYHFGEVKPDDKNQKKVSKQIKVSLENLPDNTNLELYVSASNSTYSHGKKSNIVNIKLK